MIKQSAVSISIRTTIDNVNEVIRKRCYISFDLGTIERATNKLDFDEVGEAIADYKVTYVTMFGSIMLCFFINRNLSALNFSLPSIPLSIFASFFIVFRFVIAVRLVEDFFFLINLIDIRMGFLF